MNKRLKLYIYPGIPGLFRGLFLAAALFVATGVASGPARALDLGLTTNQVFSLWTNINNAVLVTAETAIADPALWDEVKKIETKSFSGKTPADVFEKVGEFHITFGRLRIKSDLSANHTIHGSVGETTPSDVFIHSKDVLNDISEWLAVNTGPKTLIAPLYGRHQFSGKTPSDVYALVDLANRRIKAILRLAGIG